MSVFQDKVDSLISKINEVRQTHNERFNNLNTFLQGKLANLIIGPFSLTFTGLNAIRMSSTSLAIPHEIELINYFSYAQKDNSYINIGIDASNWFGEYQTITATNNRVTIDIPNVPADYNAYLHVIFKFSSDNPVYQPFVFLDRTEFLDVFPFVHPNDKLLWATYESLKYGPTIMWPLYSKDEMPNAFDVISHLAPVYNIIALDTKGIISQLCLKMHKLNMNKLLWTSLSNKNEKDYNKDFIEQDYERLIHFSVIAKYSFGAEVYESGGFIFQIKAADMINRFLNSMLTKDTPAYDLDNNILFYNGVKDIEVSDPNFQFDQTAQMGYITELKNTGNFANSQVKPIVILDALSIDLKKEFRAYIAKIAKIQDEVIKKSIDKVMDYYVNNKLISKYEISSINIESESIQVVIQVIIENNVFSLSVAI
jgi:hypothetical protein